MIKTHMKLLGLRATDRVTGLSGVVTSICFDLYGCIQAALHPGLDKDGKQETQHRFDVSRLEVKNQNLVMTPPDFDADGPQAEGKQGSSDKPQFNR